MKLAIGCDHGGFLVKADIINYLKGKGYEVVDCGTYTQDSCDYPVFAAAVARKVASGEVDYGITLCKSGEGVTISANKIKGVRCGLAYNDEVAALMRQHNNCNMIAFGTSFASNEDIFRRIDIFLSSEFEGGRHQRRVDIMDNLK